MKSRKIVKILCISLLISLTGTLYGCNKKSDEFSGLLKQGNYYEAIQYYKNNKDDIGEEDTKKILSETVDDIYKSYKAGKQTSDTAISNLDTISAISDSTVNNKITETIKLIHSAEYYKSGESAYNDKQYVSAKEYYNNVIEKDDNYKNAQQKIADCNAALIKSYISEADAKAKSNDYDSAISYLQSHVQEFEDSSEIQKKIDEYTDLKLDVELVDTNNLIKIGDYFGALTEINKLSESYPKNNKLNKLQKSTEKSYLEKILPLIDENTKNKKYGEAYSICKNALEVMPDDEELNQRLEELEPLKPVLLNEMKISESEDFEHLEDHKSDYEDVVGNKYESGNLYKMSLYKEGWEDAHRGYAKVYLNSQYTKLDGIIAVSNDSEIGDFYVKILCDDKEVYSGKYNRTTAPQEISVDVRGKKWIEFMISYADEEAENEYKSYALLYQFGFTK